MAAIAVMILHKHVKPLYAFSNFEPSLFFWKEQNKIILPHQTVVLKHKVCLRDH